MHPQLLRHVAAGQRAAEGAAVLGVVGDGVPQVLQVHADLVSAPGAGPAGRTDARQVVRRHRAAALGASQRGLSRT